MMRYELFTPSITKDYSIKDFKKDLKSYIEIVTLQNKTCILLIEDYQLIKPEYLEIINSLISSGEVTGLFTYEEID
jgi:dynein heavy chain 2